jgi:cell division protein FtsQ
MAPLFQQNPAAQQSTAAPPSRKGGLLFLLVLVIVTTAATIGAFVWKADLTVRSVTTEGNRIVTKESILKLAAVPMNKRLEDVDLAAIRNRVLQSPFVKEASVHRDFPDRVLIRVEERVPVAAIAAEKLYYVDGEGQILPGVQSEFVFDLPVITGASLVQECRPGKRITHPTLLEALRVVMVAEQIANTLYRRISEIHLQTNGELLLYTAEFGIPVSFGRGNLVEKLTLLEGFWTTVVNSQGGQTLRAVDVRFADQVVARWEPPKDMVAN